jgi:heme/copper-type cytochrome/quinol oxidase subunit 3
MPIGSGKRAYVPVIYFFLIVSALILIFQFLMPGTTINYPVLLIGNGLLFIVGMITVQMTVKALSDKNTQVFLRMMYGSFLLKFFVFAIAAFIYIRLFKKEVNKPALFGCLGLYILYTVIELRSALKQSKKKNA